MGAEGFVFLMEQPPVTGFVLAGGASRRMGKDKTKLILCGETLLERQLRLLRSVCSSAAVVGPAKGSNGTAKVFPDEIAGRGPLGGIYTSLLHTATDFNLVLACDLPLMNASFLRFMCERALERRSAVTVPISPGGLFEPLCSVFRCGVFQTIRKHLDAGQNKVDALFSKVRCDAIPWREIAAAGFQPRIFTNVNTAEDYSAVERELRGSGGATARAAQ
jgi:molybdenum cofactor guanylyltransferase